ncbi:MAG: fused MFS/spermidine synthase [Halopseudomonas sp.]
MSIPGIEVHRCYDDWGPIRVFEDGLRRYLAFGDDAQQSCIDLLEPATLVYQYTQAMMLAMLYHPKPNRVTLLGLGAGSLVHSLHQLDPELQLDVVELRPLVAEIAQQWFDLPQSSQLALHLQDASVYMAQATEQSDLIFADIYNDSGMIESQLNVEFLQHCHRSLSPDGVLVLNLWEEGRGLHPLAMQRLHDQFGDQCMTCLVEDGNLIAFAFKGGVPQDNPRRLQPIAKKLGRRLNIPLHKLVGQLQPA